MTVKPTDSQYRIPLFAEELDLINLLRETNYGEVIIIVKNGVPVMAKTVQKDVKLSR